MKRKQPKIRVLLVDNSLEFLQAVSLFLSSDPRIEVAGRYQSAASALAELDHTDPHLILMDLAMPEMNGLEATRLVKQRLNPPQVILVTMFDNPEYRLAGQDALADGFVSKSELVSELMPLVYQLYTQSLAVRQAQNELSPSD